MRKLVLDTDDLPANASPEDRARHWAEGLSGVSNVAVDCPKREGFRARLTGLSVDGVHLFRAHATSIRLARERRHIANDTSDNFLLLINEGRSLLGGEQRGVQTNIGGGQALGLANNIPHLSYAMGGGSATAVQIERRRLSQFVDRPLEEYAGKVIDVRGEPLRLLCRYVGLVLSDSPSDARLANLAAAHIAELAGLALSRAVVPITFERSQGIAAARAMAIIKLVEQRSSDAGLSVETIGAALGLSARSVQLAMQSAGTTFMAELRRARLSRAKAMLQDPRFAAQSITDISGDCGFADLTTFYRAFKAEFGCRPSEFREPA